MKVIRLFLLPLLMFLLCAESLDAMKRKRDKNLALDDESCTQPSKKLKTITGALSLRPQLIGGQQYPDGKVSSLKNGLCYALAKKMKSEEDIKSLEGLSGELIGQIQKTYSLISGKVCTGPKISLNEMIDWLLISEDILDDTMQLRDLIIQLVVRQEYAALELFLNTLRTFKQQISYSVIAHDALVAVVSKLIKMKQQDFVEKYFEALSEGTLKMAVRFVYAIKYYKNVDQYDCVGLLCPNMLRTCLFLDMMPSEEDPNKCYTCWHFDFSNRASSDEKMPPVVDLFCSQEVIPAVFSLIPPVLRRIYPGLAQRMFQDVPLCSINISGNEQEASGWLYLFSGQIAQKVLSEGYRASWGLGPIQMREESNMDQALFDALA